MKKNLSLGGLRGIVLFAIAVLSLVFTGCNDRGKKVNYTMPVPQGDTTVIHGDNGASGWAIRDGQQFVHVHVTHPDSGVVDYHVPTPCYAKFSRHDSMPGTPNVNQISFLETAVDSLAWDTLVGHVHLVQYTHYYKDRYNQYYLYDTLVHTEGHATHFGLTVPFPPSNAALAWNGVSTREDGTDGQYDYTLATTIMNVKFNGGVTPTPVYKTLYREHGTDTLVNMVLVDQGLDPIHYNAWGIPDQFKSWGDIAPVYSESGQGTPVRKSTTINSTIYAPADTSVIAQNFNVQWKSPQQGSESFLGNTTEGEFLKGNYRMHYFVGATSPAFTRVFTLERQTVKVTVDGWSFDLPSPTWSNFGESHSLDSLATQGGYEQKLATNTMSVRLNGHGVDQWNGQVPARTTIKVQSSDPTPPDTTPTPPPAPTIVDSIMINHPLIYVDAHHNISKVTKRYIWSDGHTTDHDITATIENDIVCLSSGYFYGPLAIEGIDWGTATYTGSHTSGDIRYDHYEVIVMISYGVGIHKDVKGTTQRPVYLPMGYEMPYADYSFAVSALDFVSNLGTTTTQNTTYMRKLYSQGFTATLNNHTNPYSCDLEVWEADYIPRESDVCFGNVELMTFSRAQPANGAQFVDCIVVQFTNGWGLFIEGQWHYFAKEGSSACSGYPTMPATNAQGQPINYRSAMKVNGTWYIAAVQGTNGWDSWSYVTKVNGVAYTHTVSKANAIICNIGGNGLYKPIPDAQSFSMSGPVGVLNYCQNNLSNSMSSTFMTW